VVGHGRRPLQDRIGVDHLARDQVVADAEMFQRALGLRAPELVRRDLDFAQAVGFDPHVRHADLSCGG
jgi:hypothetical protein